MKTVLRAILLTALALFGAGLVRAAAPASPAGQPDSLVVRAHFIGSSDLFNQPGSAKLKEAWQLPGTAIFRNDVLDRLARLPVLYFQPAGSADQAALFRPLFEDLLTYESYIEFHAGEMLIAARLPDVRAKAWDTSLRQAFTAWKLNPAAVNADGFAGLEIKRREAPAIIRFGRTGVWTLITAGPERLTLAPAALAAIKTQGRPGKATGAWLEGDANLARFSPMLPVLNDFQNIPLAHFSFSNRADYVRTLVKLEFPRPHNWKPEPWIIPTNNIYDPLISFVAVRGIAPLLDAIPSLRQVGWTPTPSQFCGWGMRKLPFQFFYATPAHDIPAKLHQIAPRLQQVVFGNNPSVVGRVAESTNGTELYWPGLPMAVPRLAPLRGNSNFLAFEMFPLAATKTRAPAQLFQQLSPNNLVYYDWEITEDRIPSWRQMYQMAEIGTRRMLTSTNAPSERFITDLAPRLGESVTELSATAPNEMTLVRKSHVGLTSFELVTLSRWLCSTNFPKAGIFLPQSPRRFPSRATPPPGRK